MTKEQKSYALEMLKEAGMMIAFYHEKMGTEDICPDKALDQAIPLMAILMESFPMQYIQPPPPENDELVPNRIGKWIYQKSDAGGALTVIVNETPDHQLAYYSDDAGRYILISKAKGQWGGYVGPLDDE